MGQEYSCPVLRWRCMDTEKQIHEIAVLCGKSGGIACALEGREFIGIEREPDYMEIARRRIEHWAQQQPMLI